MTEPTQVYYQTADRNPIYAENGGGSIYFQTGNNHEYVVVPQSGKVRELSHGEKRIRRRSAKSRSSGGSQRFGIRNGVLYLVPDNKSFMKGDLSRVCSSKDQIQMYYLNEDLKYVVYGDYRVVYIFPMDETQTELPAVLEHPNAYVVKMTRAVSGPKEIKINRLEDLQEITKKLMKRPTSRPRTGKDVQLIFKKLNSLID